MRYPERVQGALKYLAVLLPSFLALQACLTIMHEFTHSTVAWLLGYMQSPLDIVWGNPLMMTGWDEGVDYQTLFSQGKLHSAALIGVSPLIVHAMVVLLGFKVMTKTWLLARKWVFHLVFWFVIANLMELIAYILMRGFSDHGDTGNFNRGMDISPWYLFVLGSLALAAAMNFLYRNILPHVYEVFAPENPMLRWTIFAMSAFIMFFWGSGIRVMAYVYPDPQWLFGALSFPAVILVVYLYSPGKQALDNLGHG